MPKVRLNEHFDAVRGLAEDLIQCRGLRCNGQAKVLQVNNEVLLLGSCNSTSNSLGNGQRLAVEARTELRESPVVAEWSEMLDRPSPARSGIVAPSIKCAEKE